MTQITILLSVPTWVIENWGWLLAWFLSGLACSIIWPIKYRDGMSGEWPTFFKLWPIFGLFGPFALIVAFPV